MRGVFVRSDRRGALGTSQESGHPSSLVKGMHEALTLV